MEQTLTAELIPIKQSDLSLDVMRGIGLFGILLMNINGFGFGYNDPMVQGGDTGLNLYTWIMTNHFFEGTTRYEQNQPQTLGIVHIKPKKP